MKVEHPIACDLTAIPASERERHFTVTAPQVFQSAQEVYELPDGYAFLFPPEPDLFGMLVRLVENERRCCPFVGFQIEIEPGGERLWLRMKGSQDVKAFLQTTLGDLRKAVKNGLVQTGSDDALEEQVTAAPTVLANALRKARPVPPARHQSPTET